MFCKIGVKIKTLAKVLCWIGIIISVLSAVSLFVLTGYIREYTVFSASSVGIGVAILILGPILSWISSFILYGFGELIDTNMQINEKNDDIIANQKEIIGYLMSDEQPKNTAIKP